MPTPAAPSAAADFPGVDLDGWNYFGKLLKEFHPELRSECGVEVKQEAAPEPHGEMLVAASARASRAARSPPPSDAAQTDAWAAVARAATAREAEQGLARLDRQPVVTFTAKLGRGGSRSDYAGSAARPAPKLSHVFSLQRPIDANARESSFLAYQTRAAARVVPAGRGGHAQQQRCARAWCTRRKQDAGRRAADDAQHAAGPDARASRRSRPAVAMARGAPAPLARLRPGATSPATPRAFVDGAAPAEGGPFVVDELDAAAAARAADPHRRAQPADDDARLCEPRARGRHAIRSLVPQQVASLRSICNKICDKRRRRQRLGGVGAARPHAQRPAPAQARAGLAHHGPRGVGGVPVHQLRARRGDAPRAHGPARIEGPRRKAAAKQAAPGKAVARGQARWAVAARYRQRGRARAGPEADVDRGPERARSRARAARAARKLAGTGSAAGEHDKQTLSLKRKRPPCSGVVQVSGGVLDYWAAALSSEYASILKLMITQRKALANQASVADAHGPGAARVQQRAQRAAGGHLERATPSRAPRRSRGWWSPRPSACPRS